MFDYDVYVGHPIKNETFCFSTLNLHARLTKSRVYLSCLLCYTHVPFRHVSQFHLLLLGNIRRQSKHAWTAEYRWLPWHQIKIYGTFFNKTIERKLKKFKLSRISGILVTYFL